MKKPRGNWADSMKTDNPNICSEIVARRRAEANLLNQLLDRDDKVSIEGGKLVVVPASGKPVPDRWLKEYEPALIEQIAVQTDIAIFRYTEYSTGKYDKYFYEGVTLQFDDVTTLADAYTIFNCILTRARTTKHGAADKPLPNKHFSLSKRYKLHGLLRRSGVEPRRLSEAYKSMHKLKNLLFTGCYLTGSRLDKDSITPLNLTHQELIERLKTPRQQCDNSATKLRQQRDKTATNYHDKISADSHTQRASQPSTATGAFNHGKRTTLQGDTVTRVTATPPISTPISTPKETTEGNGESGLTPDGQEWSDDYGPVPTSEQSS